MWANLRLIVLKRSQDCLPRSFKQSEIDCVWKDYNSSVTILRSSHISAGKITITHHPNFLDAACIHIFLMPAHRNLFWPFYNIIHFVCWWFCKQHFISATQVIVVVVIAILCWRVSTLSWDDSKNFFLLRTCMYVPSCCTYDRREFQFHLIAHLHLVLFDERRINDVEWMMMKKEKKSRVVAPDNE